MAIINGTNLADVLNGTASADTISGLDGDDELYGADGNDSLDGGNGADFLGGDAGNDTLNGGAGADALAGGDGDDVYIVDNAGDIVYEFTSNTGYDEVRSSVSFSVNNFGAAAIEDLYLTGTANINGTGNSQANYIEGNSGANILDGKAGADSLAGGDGDDVYIVDNTADVVYEFTSNTGYDEVQSSVSYSISPFASGGVEDLVLTGTANINGTGNALANFIQGNAGINILDGKAGADSLAGGDGDDVYIVDNTADVVYEFTSNTGYDEVQSSVSYSINTFAAGGVEDLVLTGSANVNGTGNALANFVQGNSGNNVLDGKGGVDSLAGGDGDDTYIVDNASDVVYEFTSNTGYDNVQSSVTYSINTFAAGGVDELYLTGTGNINGTGNALGNGIVGNSGDNTINANGGDDSVAAGAGNDIVNAGDGTDIVFGEDGTDILNGGNGNDQLYGGNGADTLTGEAGNDSLYGAAGNDAYIFSGTFGSDYISDTEVAANTDAATFAGADYNHLWFAQVGNNLEISVVGASDKVTVSNWFTSTNNRIEVVNDSGSHVLNANKVAGLVSALSSFSPQVLSGNATLIAARDAAWI